MWKRMATFSQISSKEMGIELESVCHQKPARRKSGGRMYKGRNTQHKDPGAGTNLSREAIP